MVTVDDNPSSFRTTTSSTNSRDMDDYDDTTTYYDILLPAIVLQIEIKTQAIQSSSINLDDLIHDVVQKRLRKTFQKAFSERFVNLVLLAVHSNTNRDLRSTTTSNGQLYPSFATSNGQQRLLQQEQDIERIESRFNGHLTLSSSATTIVDGSTDGSVMVTESTMENNNSSANTLLLYEHELVYNLVKEFLNEKRIQRSLNQELIKRGVVNDDNDDIVGSVQMDVAPFEAQSFPFLSSPPTPSTSTISATPSTTMTLIPSSFGSRESDVPVSPSSVPSISTQFPSLSPSARTPFPSVSRHPSMSPSATPIPSKSRNPSVSPSIPPFPSQNPSFSRPSISSKLPSEVPLMLSLSMVPSSDPTTLTSMPSAAKIITNASTGTSGDASTNFTDNTNKTNEEDTNGEVKRRSSGGSENVGLISSTSMPRSNVGVGIGIGVAMASLMALLLSVVILMFVSFRRRRQRQEYEDGRRNQVQTNARRLDDTLIRRRVRVSQAAARNERFLEEFDNLFDHDLAPIQYEYSNSSLGDRRIRSISDEDETLSHLAMSLDVLSCTGSGSMLDDLSKAATLLNLEDSDDDDDSASFGPDLEDPMRTATPPRPRAITTGSVALNEKEHHSVVEDDDDEEEELSMSSSRDPTPARLKQDYYHLNRMSSSLADHSTDGLNTVDDDNLVATVSTCTIAGHDQTGMTDQSNIAPHSTSSYEVGETVASLSSHTSSSLLDQPPRSLVSTQTNQASTDRLSCNSPEGTTHSSDDVGSNVGSSYTSTDTATSRTTVYPNEDSTTSTGTKEYSDECSSSPLETPLDAATSSSKAVGGVVNSCATDTAAVPDNDDGDEADDQNASDAESSKRLEQLCTLPAVRHYLMQHDIHESLCGGSSSSSASSHDEDDAHRNNDDESPTFRHDDDEKDSRPNESSTTTPSSISISLDEEHTMVLSI